MGLNLKELRKKIVNYKAIIISLVLVLIGLISFYFSYGNQNTEYVLLSQISSAIISIGLLSIIWQLFLERTFLDEVLLNLNINNNLKEAGITKIETNFRKIDWDSYFERVKDIDLFFAWSRTWRNTNRENLDNLSNKDVNIRLILPDPDDNDTMNTLSNRWKMEANEVKTNIRETSDDFKSIFESNKRAHLRIWYIKLAPLFTLYRFDGETLMAIYTHRENKPSVPTFKFMNGPIYTFIADEIKYMTEECEFRRIIYDNKS